MFNDISCDTKDNEKECLANARLVSLYARRFGKGQWSFIGPGSEKKWYSMKEDSPHGIWDNLAEKMSLEFAESGCPIFRATTPLSRGQLKCKGHGKLSIHFAAVPETIETIFRIIVSANQLSLYGAVAEMCEEYESLSAYEVSKKVIHLLRHSQKVHREEDGAVHFWRIKENLQNPFPQSIHWSDDKWKKSMAGGGGNKKRFQYCTDDSGTIVYFRALQGHSGGNLIDPSLQDNVVIPRKFFQYIYHIECAFNLHSIIINSGLIPGGQKSSKRQTVSFLPVDPMDKSHKDPDEIDLNVPRRAQYLHNAWKRHQDAVNWIDINLAIEKGLTFYQTRSNEIILQETIPAYCIPKVVRLKTGEVLYEKVYMSPRPPPKISLKHEWKRELGSEVAPENEVARQPEGEVARQAIFFQPTRPIPNPIRERPGRPDNMQDGTNTSRSQEISLNSL